MYLLFDIGGTKTRVALSRDGKSFEEPRIVPTSANYEESMNMLASILFSAGGFPYLGVAVLIIVGMIGGYFIFNYIFKDPEKSRSKLRRDTQHLMETQPSSDSFYLSLSKKNRLDPITSQKPTEPVQEIICPHCSFLNQRNSPNKLTELSCSNCQKRILII